MILKTETHNAVMLAMLLLQINQNRLSEKNKYKDWTTMKNENRKLMGNVSPVEESRMIVEK